MRVAWLTDLHLEFVESPGIEALAGRVREARVDAALIGGDTAHAADVVEHLERLGMLLRIPIFFVLGNHDYYGSSIAAVRAKVNDFVNRTRNLTWLTAVGRVSLTAETALIGDDGWGDCGFGDALGTPVVLNDFLLIDELRVADPVELVEQRAGSRERLLAALRQLGEESAAHLHDALTQALQSHRHVVALMHVPPFREAAWYEGRVSDDRWLPFFVCKAAGIVLRDIMAAHPTCHLTVLCGHTHGAGRCRVLPNLEVITGGAEYGCPAIQEVIDIL
jgi:3',5'-cyclic AMP phosphodiesterase CpdA